MKTKTQRYKNKKGGSVIALVIVLMLIFPFIVSGLIDLTNCSVLKRTVKQELNSSAKAAANTIDVKATKNGVYRIADGVLAKEVYGSKTQDGLYYDNQNYYVPSYNNAGRIFFQTLSLNELIDENAWETCSKDTQKVTYTNGYSGKVYSSSAPMLSYSMTGDKSSNDLKRSTKVMFTIVNNNYEYNKEMDVYVKNHPSATIDIVPVVIDNNTGLVEGASNSWANWNPMGKTPTDNTTLYVNSYRPTVVAMAVVEYEPSKIFNVFGNNYEKIYIKEYATAELIISDNYWQEEKVEEMIVHTEPDVWAYNEYYHYKNCSVCGVNIYSIPHTYTSVTISNATCTIMGISKYTCPCGYNYQATDIQPLGHGWASGYSYDDTYHYVNCSRCSEVKNQETHSYQSTIVSSASCTTMGTTRYSCTCGYAFLKVDIDALGHDTPTIWQYNSNGHFKLCERCDTTLDSAIHTYNTSTVSIQDCVTDGVTKYACECGYYYTLTNAALGHNVPKVWKYNDSTHYYECTRCQTKENEETHFYSSQLDTLPDCENKGFTTFTCDCGYSYQGNFVNALGHTTPSSWAYNDDIHYKDCGLCAKRLSEENHNFVTQVIANPTCTSMGITRYTCSTCSYTIDKSDIPQVDHTPESTWHNDDSTAHYKNCVNCGAQTNVEVHTFTSKITKQATCVAGNRRYTCSVCGYYYDVSLPPVQSHADNDVNGYCDVCNLKGTIVTVYHTHTGSSSSGGGCYTVPITHSHTGTPGLTYANGCYTKPVTSSVYCGSGVDTVEGPCSWWWDDANNRCIRCWSTDRNNLHYKTVCSNCGESCGSTHYKTVTTYQLNCNKSTNVTGYSLGCNKTTSTIESKYTTFN